LDIRQQNNGDRKGLDSKRHRANRKPRNRSELTSDIKKLDKTLNRTETLDNECLLKSLMSNRQKLMHRFHPDNRIINDRTIDSHVKNSR